MKKPVAILSSILLAGSIVMTSVTPVMAGNASYKFYSLNGVSKENYNTSWQEFNTKAVTGRDWVVKASKITLPDNTTPSYGVAHVLFNAKTEALATNIIWLKTAGRKTGTWKSNYGKKGELYEIGARLDTVYGKKTGTSEGVFNSDAY